MAYEKQTWQDEILADPTARYNITREDGSLLVAGAKIDLATAVEQAGTRVTAERMNHIEDGIATAGHEFETDPANIKQDGTAAVGVLDTVARADHVHPASLAMGFSLIPVGDKIIDWKQPGCYRVLEWESYPDAPQDAEFNHATILVVASPNLSDTGSQIAYSNNAPGVTFTRTWSGTSVLSWVKQRGGDTGWIDVTLAPGWTGNLRYRSSNGIVMVIGESLKSSANVTRWDVIGTLPAAIKTGISFKIGALTTAQSAASAVYELYFNTTGEIQVYAQTYPADTPINFMTTYLI